jgi:GR25 family glycosyltransferase involved in LPS biosynthesis/tetratricopeptide (TPR) repeat protein
MELTITEKEEKSIALNMIVKNESHIIEKTLQNLCEYISFDYWVICDTGSTDGTQNLIKKFFKAKNIKGELHQCEWKDFGHNRTEALEKAFNKTDYLLIFDADDSIQGDFNLPMQWKHDSYSLKFGNITAGEVIYKRVLLINNRKKYAFHGVLHEFIVGISDNITETSIKGDYYLISGREGSRSQNPNKYLDDALILEKGFNEEINDESLKHRYAFYCAQSYKDAGKTDKSIYWFQKALTLPIWTQEKYYSCYQLGYLYEKKGEDEKAIHYWLKTSQYDPERIEGIVSACNKYKDMGLNEIAVSLYSHYSNYAKWTTNLYDKLFVEVNRYQQELEYHCSIAAGYTRDKKCGYECCKTILLCQQQPPRVLKCTINNLQYYKKFLEEDPDSLQLFYAVDNLLSQIENTKICFDIWMFLFMQNREKMTKLPQLTIYPCNKDKPFIFLSFTTCKRWDLFQQTMNSILNHWGDYNKIEYWFCVDDNSSKEDRNAMQTTYPWIDYYMKKPSEKGHRPSMNIIWDKLAELKPTYWIHMEDDFLFHRKYNYIDKAIECLQKYKDKNVKQVLFNRGYGETIEDYSITSYIPLDDEFSLHDHKQGHFSTRNCHYWPHYSFRPSIIDVETILKLGNYDSYNQFFEMDYANRWNDAGYKSAFFNCITNRHIGRLTSQRNNKELPNAYDLNNEGQFKRITPFIKIVNLKRRVDRKKSTIDKLAAVDCHSYTFIKAIDGKTLRSTHEIKKIFKKNDFGNRKGVIGCALSHYYLWKSLIEDEKHDFYLILEDDFTLCDGFKEKIEGLKTEMKNKEILFLGYHMFEKEREKVSEIYDCSSNNVQVSKLNQSIFIGGTFSYSINTAGARHLIDYIEKNGIQHGIDYVIGKLNNKICYETKPHLCFSVWNENNKECDSDIQNDHTSLDLTEPYIHIINLERRKDRKKKMIEQLDANKVTNYEFFKAFDGSTMVGTTTLKELFKGNDFSNNRGAIGCAMSHLTLWKQLLQDDDNDFYLILEDDIQFTDDYSKKFNQIWESDQKDIIFLGYSMAEKERNKIDISDSTVQLNKLNKTRYIGGLFSYLINKNGAKKLIDYIDKNGIKHGIDYLIKKIDTLDCYEVSPQLTFTKWNEDNIAIDSDIQGTYTSIQFPQNEFIFVQGLDQLGNDLYYQKTTNEQYIQRADKDENCVAFNTLGFFKDKIDCLTPSPYFGEEDGIYIKKEYYEAYQLERKNVSKGKSGHHTIQKIYEKDSHILNDVFIETGSFKGGGIRAALDIGFKEIHSIELSDKYFNICKERFKNFPQVHLHLGDSGILLGHILSKINTGVTFWLDGHYSSMDTACAENYCSPVQQELQFIKQYNHPKHVILIDDMKDFTDKSIQWNLSTHKKCGYIPKRDLEERLKEIHTNSKIYYFGPACISYNKRNQLQPKLDNPVINYKRVKMLCNWCSSEQLCKEWSTMCEEGLHWKDIELTSEDENIDYYVIINKPQEGAIYDPKKTLVFQMEPWIYNATKNWGVHTWGKWSRPDEKKFLYVGRHKNGLNNVQWQIKIPDTIPEERENKALTFLSAKNFDWGHKKRIEFLKKLEEWQKGEEGRTSLIDIYGRENYHSLTHYKGPLKDDKKENHFIHYKYCFAVENNSERNYATEKIWEPILCECLTFYWGCPGLEKHINEKAFVRLNITDFEGSLAIIQQAIKEDWWSQRIDIIRQEKQRIINELGFFPRLRKILLH